MAAVTTTAGIGAAVARSGVGVSSVVQRWYDDAADHGLRGPAAVLRAALAAGRLEVHYQPLVSLPDRRVLGFEALARLRSPDSALVPPDEFIALAESSGLIIPLGLEVLATAAAALAVWRQQAELAGIYVSVNVSPVQLVDPSFGDAVRSVLRANGLPASALVLEVTESGATGPDAAETLTAVAATGVRLALDDFGTGFATLDSVKRLPVQILKLDRGFVAGIADGGSDTAIVRHVLALAYDLNLTVIAEGVETEMQAESLAAWGCDAGQGWLFGRPAPTNGAAPVSPIPAAPSTTPAVVGSWNPPARETANALAHVLATTDGGSEQRRALVHAVATALARTLRLPATIIADVGRLALCHDIARVQPLLGDTVDASSLLAAIAEQPTGAAVPVTTPPGELVALAADVVGSATTDADTWRPAALRRALVAAAAAVRGDGAGLDEALRRVADEVMTLRVTPLEELLAAHAGRAGPGAGRAIGERLRGLLTLAKALAVDADPLELVGFLADEAREVLGAASVSISRVDHDQRRLRVLVNVGDLAADEQRYPDDEHYAFGDYDLVGRMSQAGMPNLARVDDPSADPAERALLRRLGKGSSAAVPIYRSDQLWGELYATTDVGAVAFGARDVELLTSVAGVIGGTLAHSEHVARLTRLATRDALTGLANRHVVEERLDDALARADAPVTLVMLDVNGLKQVNDEYGHAVGDRALCAVADALRAATRSLPDSVAARLGGDEFCIIVPGDAHAAAAIVTATAEHLRRASAPQVTIAAGSASRDALRRTSGALFVAADRTQYTAKHSGRQLLDADADANTGAAADADRDALVHTSRDRRTRPRTVDAGPRPLPGRGDSVTQAVVEVLSAMADAAAPDVLEAVAQRVAGRLDLSRWGLSHAGDDGLLRVVSLHLRRTRPQPDPGALPSPQEESWALADYPLSVAAVEEGRPFWVHVDRADHEDGERSVLRDFGMTALVGIGVRDRQGAWLLELYGDHHTGDLEVLLPLAHVVALALRDWS